MSTSQFMRGDPLDYSQSFYLAYTNSNNLTYVYCYNSSGYTTTNSKPVAGFLEMTSSYSSYEPVLFTITSMGNNSYSFYSNGFYLGLNSSNIIDLVSTSISAITLLAPSNATANIYNIQNTLYPSVNYASYINNIIYKWYIFTPLSSWNSYTISFNNVTPFIFPSNSGQLALWQVTSDYPSGSCFYSSTDNGIALEWLYNWTQGTSTNCDTAGTLNSTYNNCYFSSLVSCESLYVYNLCTGSNTCGTCQGIVSNSDACYYNIPGSSPPLYAATGPSTLTTNDAIEIPNTNSSSGSCSTNTIIIVIIIIFVIIIFIIIVYALSKSGSKKESPPAPAPQAPKAHPTTQPKPQPKRYPPPPQQPIAH